MPPIHPHTTQHSCTPLSPPPPSSLTHCQPTNQPTLYAVNDIEVNNGSMFRPYFARQELLILLLKTMHSMEPNQYVSRSPVMKNKTYEQRYYENYVYYIPDEWNTARIDRARDANEAARAERKAARLLAKQAEARKNRAISLLWSGIGG